MKHAKHLRVKRKSKAKKIGLTILLLLILTLVIGGTVIYFRPSLLKNLLSHVQVSSQVSSSTKPSSSKFSELTSSDSDLPKVSSADWNLVLVNRDNLQEEKMPSLTQVGEIRVDSRQFLAAAQTVAPGEILISGYRSRAEQEELYNENVAAEEAKGLSHEEAVSAVQKQIQIPGASEHQTGLAIDMSVPEGLEDELAAKIAQLAPQYGFVLRYPEGKSNITGVDFEHWHYRYVGVENAQYMQKHNLVLEEYIALLKAAEK